LISIGDVIARNSVQSSSPQKKLDFAAVAAWTKRGIIAQNLCFRDNFQFLRVDIPPSAPRSAVPIEDHHA